MAIFALIANGTVAQLAPATFPVYPALAWVDVTAVSPAPQPGWSYSGNVFAAPAATTVSLADQAAAQLATRIAAGIAITSAATPALNATYALDAVTLGQIGAVAGDSYTPLGLPGGLATFSYPDITGQPHNFAAADIQNLYRKQRDLIFALTTQAAIMAHGGTPVWPGQGASIA